MKPLGPIIEAAARPTSMQLGVTIYAGIREIWAHKFRSLLTMLGIILGVASLVAMSALVSGMEKGAREALIAIGGLEKVRVEAQEVPLDQRHLADQAVGITINDVLALQKRAAGQEHFPGYAPARDGVREWEDLPPLEPDGRLARGPGNERARHRSWADVQRD